MKSFEILASGVFPRDNLKIVHTACSLSFDQATTALIEKKWEEEQYIAHQQNKLLFNGPIYRLENFEKRDELLIVYVSHTNFKELMGTNFYHPEFAESYGKAYLSNALALSTFLETSDGKFIFVKRSRSVYFGVGLWHLIAGQFSIEKDDTHTLSVFEVLFKELFEESSLNKEEIEQSVCLGLIRENVHFKPELVFYTKTTLSARDVIDKINTAHDGHEHEEVKAVQRDELDSFMKNEKMTTIALGNFHLFKKEFLHNE